MIYLDMTNKEFLGINGRVIHKSLIPFEDSIEDCGIIENSNKYALLYRKDYNGYFLVTSDAYDFLPNNERFSTWKKK